jgi:hypothetical protein
VVPGVRKQVGRRVSERCAAKAWTTGEQCRLMAYYSSGLCGIHDKEATASRNRRELEKLRAAQQPPAAEDLPSSPAEWLASLGG